MLRPEFIAGLGAVVGDAVCQPNPIYAQAISAASHRTVEANGIHLHLVEQGEGQLVATGGDRSVHLAAPRRRYGGAT